MNLLDYKIANGRQAKNILVEPGGQPVKAFKLYRIVEDF
jgi:hypothetical protein